MKKMKLIVVLLLVGLLVLGCTGNYVKEPETIKLGSILILTGQGAAWGEAARNGIEMAVEDVNNDGGVLGKQIEFVHQDDQSEAKKSVSAFYQLVDAMNIDIIIGTTWSHTGLPLIDLAENNKVLMISPSLGMAEFNEGSDYLFNVWPHDAILSAKLADLVYQKGIRNIALIGAEQVWVKQQTNAFKERFEALGGTIEVMVEPDPENKAVYPEALKIAQVKDDIDAIVSTTDGILVGTLVARRLREFGVEHPIYSITIDQDTIDASKGAYEGLEFLTSLTPTDEFQKRYETKYQRSIDIGADSAYDAVMMIVEAMKITGTTDTTVLKDYLNSIQTFEGVSGHLVADGLGGFTKEFALKKVVEEKPVTITG